MKCLIFKLTIFALLFSSCQKKMTEVDFEQNVFNQVFLKLVDSTYKDKRLYTFFPPSPKPIFDKYGNWIKDDTTGQHKKNIEFEAKRNILKKDTLGLVIAINKIRHFASEHYEQFIPYYFPTFKYHISKEQFQNEIAIESFKSSKFSFKYLSELPEVEDYENWSVKYSKFAGALYFSIIKFDDKKENGILSVEYACGGKCGLTYLVRIKKKNNHWLIDKVVQIGIS